MISLPWRDLPLALSLAAFAALAGRQLLGLVARLLRRPDPAELRDILEELLWVLTAIAAVAALTIQALRGPSGG